VKMGGRQPTKSLETVSICILGLDPFGARKWGGYITTVGRICPLGVVFIWLLSLFWFLGIRGETSLGSFMTIMIGVVEKPRDLIR
jgi:hypothetical protein